MRTDPTMPRQPTNPTFSISALLADFHFDEEKSISWVQQIVKGFIIAGILQRKVVTISPAFGFNVAASGKRLKLEKGACFE
jgi:hypothetical protein